MTMLSGLDRVKYDKWQMILQYPMLSSKRSPSLGLSFRLGSVGSEAGLQAKKPQSSSTEKACFLWENEMPLPLVVQTRPIA